MKTLSIIYRRLRGASPVVRVIVAISVILIAALVKEALRPVWAHLQLDAPLMDVVVTMVELPFVVFFGSPAVRGLASSSRKGKKTAQVEPDFGIHNPFSVRLTDDLRADSGIGEPFVDMRGSDEMNR